MDNTCTFGPDTEGNFIEESNISSEIVDSCDRNWCICDTHDFEDGQTYETAVAQRQQESGWEFDLDYERGDAYLAELGAAYTANIERISDVLQAWKRERDAIDQHYWNEELLPALTEGKQLHEEALRTLVTWIAEGTQYQGQPLVEVFPEVENWMISHYDPSGSTVTESFQLDSMPFVPESPEPSAFQFTFDRAAIQQYLQRESDTYSQVEQMYTSTL